MALYFHWSHAEVMGLEHQERVRFIETLSKVKAYLPASRQ